MKSTMFGVKVEVSLKAVGSFSTNTWRLASIMIWMRRMRALVYGSSQHRALWLVVGYLTFFSCLTPNENIVKSKLINVDDNDE